MGLIEWREECDGLYGVVSGKRFFKLTKHSDMTFVLVFTDKGTSYWESLEKAKAKADELLTDWLKSAGLVQRPESCGECGDKGYSNPRVHNTCSVCYRRSYCEHQRDDCPETKYCPCTKDPNSLYSFIKEMKGG